MTFPSKRRLGLLAAPLLLAAAFSAPNLATHASASVAHFNWYVALGDSLAQGVQPDSTGASQITNNGYVDDIYGHLTATAFPRMQLEKLGCPGETTSTFISGGICDYSADIAPGQTNSQLTAAADFLATHYVRYLTIDIGANDVDGCITQPDVQACVQAALPVMANNLGEILYVLHSASPTTKIYGMNYYDPFLALWLQGPAGQVEAQQTAALTDAVNAVLRHVYSDLFGFRVADVSAAFQTDDFDISSTGLPVNVNEICLNTFMCNPAPVGPNIHATDTGYSVIALAFQAQNKYL